MSPRLRLPAANARARGPLSVSAVTLSVESNRGSDSEVRIASSRSVENPRSTAPSAIIVRITSAAPITRTTASPTSTVTSARRMRVPRNPPARLARLMKPFRSVRALASAGASPNRRPVASDRPSVKAATRQSRPSKLRALTEPRQAARVDRQEHAHADDARDEPERTAGERTATRFPRAAGARYGRGPRRAPHESRFHVRAGSLAPAKAPRRSRRQSAARKQQRRRAEVASGAPRERRLRARAEP